MSLKALVGIGINEKFIEKQKRRAVDEEKERFVMTLKVWKKSQNPVEIRIKNLIENFKDEPNYPCRFLLTHSDLLNDDQKVYAAIMLVALSEEDKDKNCKAFFIQSKSNMDFKIKNIIEASNNSNDKDFARRFFTRHPEIVPKELNPFTQKENYKELELKNKLLDKEKEILELKIKLKKYEQSQ